jgi:uncharacterized protein YbjT (DUF2867 family)
MGERILLTGATGYVGGRLAPLLLAAVAVSSTRVARAASLSFRTPANTDMRSVPISWNAVAVEPTSS